MITSTVGALLDGELDALELAGHALYLVGDGETVFYIGRSRDPVGRLWQHMGALLVLELVQPTPSRMPPGAIVGREHGKLAKIRPFPYSWGIVGALGEIEREKAPKGAPRPCVQPLCSAAMRSAPVFSSPALQDGAALAARRNRTLCPICGPAAGSRDAGGLLCTASLAVAGTWRDDKT